MGLATVVASMMLVSVAAAQIVYKQFDGFRLPGVNESGNVTYSNGLGNKDVPMKSVKFTRINLTVGVQTGFVTNLSGKLQDYKNPANFVIADPVTDNYLTPTASEYIVARTPGDHKALASFVGASVGSGPNDTRAQ